MMHNVARDKKDSARRLRRTLAIAPWALSALPAYAGPIDEWQQASRLDTCAAYQAYGAKYPDNQISKMAQERAAQRCAPIAPPTPLIAATPPAQAPEPERSTPSAAPSAPSAPPPPPPPVSVSAATSPVDPPAHPPPQPSSTADKASAIVFVDAYYAALSRADARAAAQMWLAAPQAIRYVPNNEYCNLHRRDLTYADGYSATVAVDVTCKSRGERARLYNVTLTLERDGSGWKIRSLKPR